MEKPGKIRKWKEYTDWLRIKSQNKESKHASRQRLQTESGENKS